MALVPVLDLRPAPEAPEMPHAPANIDAEQALLGTLLFDNAAFERVPDSLSASDFYEAFHGRLFEAIERCIRSGRLADPILLGDQFKSDPVFRDLGELRYLANLMEQAPPAANIADYGRAIRDLAIRRSLIQIGGDIAVDARALDTPSSGSEQIEAAEQKLFELAEVGSTSRGLIGLDRALSEAIESAKAAYSRDGGLAGLSTGLVDLDQKLGGLHPSDLVVLAARPSMGKSALGINIAFDVARNYQFEVAPDGARKTVRGGVVAFFSLEMSAEQLALRILAEVTGVPSDRIRKGEINASEFGQIKDASIELASAPLHIDDTGGLSMAKLAARARRLKRTQGLKALAKELKVPVIALAQLSRQVENREDKKPQLADLRESGSIEQDADVVMFIYREAYYVGRAEPKDNSAEHIEWEEKFDAIRHQADIIIAKQRHGPIGVVRLSYNDDLTKFSNLGREGRYEPR
jgi:replicative DNA helicase